MKVLSFIKKHWRGVLFAAYLILCVVLVIGGIGWSDYAKTPFWWTFWDIVPWLAGTGFIGGIWWFSKQKNISW